VVLYADIFEPQLRQRIAAAVHETETLVVLLDGLDSLEASFSLGRKVGHVRHEQPIDLASVECVPHADPGIHGGANTLGLSLGRRTGDGETHEEPGEKSRRSD